MTMIEVNLEEVSNSSIASIGGTGFGNTAAIKFGEYVVIIDASLYKKSATKFKNMIEQKFSTGVSHLIYTHYHGDHTFGSAPYKNALIISSEATSNNLKDNYQIGWKESLEEEDPLVSEPIEILHPQKTFENKFQIISGDLNMEIRKLGGHTSGSSIIHFVDEKVLYSGDIIFNYSFPYGADPTCDLDSWIKALKVIKSYNVDRIVPGHGPIIENKNHLNSHIEFYEYMKSSICDGIEDRISPEIIESSIEVPEIFFDRSEVRKAPSIEQWYNNYKSGNCD
jgi:glyoxylase-like metal-dependent hydrolase (beta-lactamase superfamily II)